MIAATAVYCAAPALAQSHVENEKVTLLLYEDANHQWAEHAATKAQLAATPSWDIQGDPPLSVREALANASEWIKTAHPGFTAFELEQFSLGPTMPESVGERWYYTLQINASGLLGPVSVRHQFMVLVLMDGTVVKPVPYGEAVDTADAGGPRAEELLEENVP